jgi:zinc-finger-containing domain
MHKSIICDYCGKSAPLVSGLTIYPSKPELSHKNYYLCRPCNAWVGCHKGTDTPFGRLADAGLRYWRIAAHEAFDPIWGKKAKGTKDLECYGRTAAYRWLAAKLGIHRNECHIGLFDEELCRYTIAACDEFRVWIADQSYRRERIKRLSVQDGRRRAGRRA